MFATSCWPTLSVPTVKTTHIGVRVRSRAYVSIQGVPRCKYRDIPFPCGGSPAFSAYTQASLLALIFSSPLSNISPPEGWMSSHRCKAGWVPRGS